MFYCFKQELGNDYFFFEENKLLTPSAIPPNKLLKIPVDAF
jgi:hypothetical protein